jgi:hypothetical protein
MRAWLQLFWAMPRPAIPRQEIVAEGARHVDVLIRSLVEFGAPRISLSGGLASRLVQWLSADALEFFPRPKAMRWLAPCSWRPSRGTRSNRAEAAEKGAQIC